MRALLLASAALVCLAVPASAASRPDCGKTIKMHGVLSRAQFQCGFSRYSEAMMDEARSCSRQVGDKAVKSNLKSGMTLFDQRESEWGHDVVCSKILADFPKIIAR